MDLNKTYKKQDSISKINFKDSYYESETIQRITKISKNEKFVSDLSIAHQNILKRAITDLNSKDKKNRKDKFKLTSYAIAEINILPDIFLLRYLVHRYRYEIFPITKEIDEFPPYLQIEPTSICNYRCVFCFETDTTFTNKKNGFMGNMTHDLFKKIIDDAEGNVEFVTLASRGEPLACKDIKQMLSYTNDKFISLKLNTNASLLSEDKCHAILSSGVRTLIFSADAADEKLYAKLRVNGKLSTVLKNIERFHNIKEKQYSNKKMITRVSGVKFSKEQNFDDMKNLWQGLVDQVAFVEYNPWENSYDKSHNEIVEPCSDLWRRMFIWWDGKANPCDIDYKSMLSTGTFHEKNLSELWQSESYNVLRESHLNQGRQKITPCKSCYLV